MGKVRLVVGRSGSGKTYFCINEFVKVLESYRRFDGKTDAFLIVPEQFAVDYERKVLNHPDCRGLLGSEVISFNRLAHRIITEKGLVERPALSSAGKAMLLVNIMRELDEAGKLVYYRQCAGNAKSIAGLIETMSEFSKYCVHENLLISAAEKTQNNDALRAKLTELALIYREFSRGLEAKYTDSASVMKKAAVMVKNCETEVSKAVIWIDGFSGFTEAELLLVNAFAEVCPQVNICLFYDDKNSLIFSCPNETKRQLESRFTSLGHTVEVKEVGKESCFENEYKGSRYEKALSLGVLEETYGRMKKSFRQKIGASDIKIFSCIDSYREIENCAEQIKKLINDGYKFNEIAVVSSGLEEKQAVFRAVFSRAGIPYFLDNKRELSGHPVVRYILSMLEIIANNMTGETVFEMLKTGLFRSGAYSSECIDILENRALALGVNTKTSWERMCKKFALELKAGEECEVPEYVKLAEDIYSVIYGENGLNKKASACKNINDYCRIILEFAADTGLEESVEFITRSLSGSGMEDVADTYLRVWNVFVEITEQAKLIVGDISIRGYKKCAAFFADIIRVSLGTYKIGFIPFTTRCVQIGNVDRSRYLDKKVTFIIGANEGQFPQKFSESGVLGDLERELLKECGATLAYNSLERTYFAQFNVYSVLVSPSERLFISSSCSNTKGDVLFPAPCIAGIKGLFSDIETVNVDPEIYEGLYDFEAESSDVFIKPELAAKLLKIGTECKMSVSRLEKYKMCPYEFFLKSCLRLKERELGNVEKTNVGTYFHGLIEHASKDRNFTAGKISRDVLREMVKDAAADFFNDPENDNLKYLFENSYKNAFLKNRIEDFALSDIGNIAEIMDKTGFKPFAHELAFGFADDKSLPPVKIPCESTDLLLRGYIDRIDVRDNGDRREVAVVDYKAKAQTFGVSQIEQGLKLQLLTYLYAVSENKNYFKDSTVSEVVPAAVLYYVYGKDSKDYSSKHDSKKNKFHEYSGFADSGVFTEEIRFAPDSKLSGVDDADLQSLVDIVKEEIKGEFAAISSGDFSITPHEEITPCKWCKSKDICRKSKS